MSDDVPDVPAISDDAVVEMLRFVPRYIVVYVGAEKSREVYGWAVMDTALCCLVSSLLTQSVAHLMLEGMERLLGLNGGPKERE